MNKPQLVLSTNTGSTARERIARLEAEFATSRIANQQEVDRIRERFIIGPWPVRIIRGWVQAPVVDYHRTLRAEAAKYESRLPEILNLLDAEEPRRAGSKIMDLMEQIQNEVFELLDDHSGQGSHTVREEKAIRLKDIHEKLEGIHESLMNEIYVQSKSR